MLVLLSAGSPFAAGALQTVNIDGDHIYINEQQDRETLFNITNNGSLTINNAEWGFSSKEQKGYAHQLQESTLYLGNQAIFQGDITSANSHIIFSESTYTGTIRADASAALGDVYINASVVNGSIRTGTHNGGQTLTIKDSVINGQGILTPLAIYSGSMIIENSTLKNHNFSVIDIRNAHSAILKDVKINSTSDHQGNLLSGISGILIQDSRNVDIMNSTITSEGTAVRMRNDNEGTPDNLFISSSTLTGKAGAALEASNSNIHIYDTKLETSYDSDDNACYNNSKALNGCGSLNLEGANVIVNQSSEIVSDNVGVFITGEKQAQLDINNSTIYSEKAAFSINEGNSRINLYNNYAIRPGTSSVISGSGMLLEATNNSSVDLSVQCVYPK